MNSASGLTRTAGFVVLLTLISVIAVSAQVNTEQKRLGLKESGLSGDGSVSVALIRGNSELTRIGVGLNMVWRSGKHQLFTLNDLTSIRDEEGSIVNKGFSHLRYNFDLTSIYVAEVFTQLQFDKSQDLDHRFLIGGGIRVVPLSGEQLTLAVGCAVMYEEEELTTDESQHTLRNSNYLSLRLTGERGISFVQTLYVQPALEDLSDYRILEQAQLTVALFGGVSFITTLNWLYDALPPQGVTDYDLELSHGLKVSF